MDIEEASKEVLYDWEQKVSDEWLKRNKRAGEAYRSANSDYNPDVTVLIDVEGEDEMLRSTVVGDELLYEGKRYRVDEYGFKLVTETS